MGKYSDVISTCALVVSLSSMGLVGANFIFQYFYSPDDLKIFAALSDVEKIGSDSGDAAVFLINNSRNPVSVESLKILQFSGVGLPTSYCRDTNLIGDGVPFVPLIRGQKMNIHNAENKVYFGTFASRDEYLVNGVPQQGESFVLEAHKDYKVDIKYSGLAISPRDQNVVICLNVGLFNKNGNYFQALCSVGRKMNWIDDHNDARLSEGPAFNDVASTILPAGKDENCKVIGGAK